MGTFLGHFLPGSFFLAFSCWWMFGTFRNYFQSKFKRKRFYNLTTYNCQWYPNIPMEAIIKLSLISIGIVGETYTAFRGGKFVNIGNGQHITMFAFFSFNAAVDLVNFYRSDLLPPDMEYLTALLAFCIEWFLFSQHLHGRSDIDVQLHHFLLMAIAFTIISILFELLYREKVVFGLCRSLGTFVQGTWFIQVGFYLYNPLGENIANNHMAMMISTMVFAWHIAAALAVMFGLGIIIYVKEKNDHSHQYMPASQDADILETNLSDTDGGDVSPLLLHKQFVV